MEDVLVIGEALVDIVSAAGQAAVEHVGGSPANVALGLARLGHHTRLLTRIGDDARGEMVRRHLEASGVELVAGSVTSGATSTATAHLNAARVASYAFDLDWSLPGDANLGTATAVHTGSIAATLEPGGLDVARLVEAASGRCLVSYDPNARPTLMGSPELALPVVERIVRACDVVKVSDEDLEWLTPGADPIEVAQSWVRSGPALVVVTRGAMGAFAVLTSGVIAVPTLQITVADTVGAGDALMAGLLDALSHADLLSAEAVPRLRGARLAEIEPILNHAVAVAALTCTRPGADPPNQQELARWLATRSSTSA